MQTRVNFISREKSQEGKKIFSAPMPRMAEKPFRTALFFLVTAFLLGSHQDKKLTYGRAKAMKLKLKPVKTLKLILGVQVKLPLLLNQTL